MKLSIIIRGPMDSQALAVRGVLQTLLIFLHLEQPLGVRMASAHQQQQQAHQPPAGRGHAGRPVEPCIIHTGTPRRVSSDRTPLCVGRVSGLLRWARLLSTAAAATLEVFRRTRRGGSARLSYTTSDRVEPMWLQWTLHHPVQHVAYHATCLEAAGVAVGESHAPRIPMRWCMCTVSRSARSTHLDHRCHLLVVFAEDVVMMTLWFGDGSGAREGGNKYRLWCSTKHALDI
jgi:hypothetical protein